MGEPALSQKAVCKRLGIDDFRFVEIESKWRVLPEQADRLREHLLGMRKVEHLKSRTYFDQFLDTPELDLLRLGASLRLRYRGDGTSVKLQYKGPGFRWGGALFRSEFSSQTLDGVVHEESHHDIIHFTDLSVAEILERRAEVWMRGAMLRHLGAKTVARIGTGLILCIYHKDKFRVDLGKARLEPSLDRLFAFLITRKGLHPMSTFCEFENEVKADPGDYDEKIKHLDDLRDFDEDLAKDFDLKPEPFDKYHRCASSFQPLGGGKGRSPEKDALAHILRSL